MLPLLRLEPVKDIYDIVAEAGEDIAGLFALATLVRAEGSSYRRPGARLLICTDGRTLGSLSGGCIEDEIAARATDVIKSGQAVVVEFDTRRRFGCHGKIYVLIERIDRAFLEQLRDELRARRKCFVVTTAEGSTVHASPFVRLSNDDPSDFPATPFVQEIHPPIRLIIFGDGPDTSPLQNFCSVLGWQSAEISNVSELPTEADEWTAAIVKSHNFGRDFVALAKLLPLNLRYVGLIGPKKRRDELLSGLLEIGISMTPGFFGPAGLDLGAESPEGIALAVVSEIQRVFGQASGQSLRDRKQPIHGRNQTGAQNRAI
ncbi:MAG: XdhC family protein [Chthoniobacterales bacterium]